MIKDYLGKSEWVGSIEIFPVSVLEWEEFSNVSGSYLLYGYNFIKYRLKPKTEIKIFDLIISMIASEITETKELYCSSVQNLERMFEIVTKRKSKLVTNGVDVWYVEVDGMGKVDRDNYDIIREVVMRQNLIFEPLIVEDEYTQKLIDKAVKVRNKTGGNFDFQSMLVYVCNKRNILPSQLTNYTYYQLRCDNEMLQRLDFNNGVPIYRSQGAKVDMIEVYKSLDTLSNPNSWDSFFVKEDKQADAEMQRMLGG